MVTKTDYNQIAVDAAYSVLIEIIRILGEYKDNIVLIGGWVPQIVFQNKSELHTGSIDIDLALDHKHISDEGYQGIYDLLVGRGYQQGKQPFIFHRTVSTQGMEIRVQVDFLSGEYEGKRAEFKKMNGRPYRELFEDLHNHGISVLASMIIGFDYQTPEIIKNEYDELLSLRPSLSQFLIYGPVRDTPLYNRLNSEKRLNPEVVNDYTKHDGFSLGFAHPNISAEDMSKIQRHLYQEEFERLGPSIFRILEDWLTGYINLRNHPLDRVRAKAKKYGDDAHRCLPLIPASKKYLNSLICGWLDGLEETLVLETGPNTRQEKLLSLLLPLKLWQTSFKAHHNIGQQPEFTKRTFRMKKAKDKKPVADFGIRFNRIAKDMCN